MIPDAFKAKPKDPSDNDTPVVKNPKNPKNPKLVDATLSKSSFNLRSERQLITTRSQTFKRATSNPLPKSDEHSSME